MKKKLIMLMFIFLPFMVKAEVITQGDDVYVKKEFNENEICQNLTGVKKFIMPFSFSNSNDLLVFTIDESLFSDDEPRATSFNNVNEGVNIIPLESNSSSSSNISTLLQYIGFYVYSYDGKCTDVTTLYFYDYINNFSLLDKLLYFEVLDDSVKVINSRDMLPTFLSNLTVYFGGEDKSYNGINGGFYYLTEDTEKNSSKKYYERNNRSSYSKFTLITNEEIGDEPVTGLYEKVMLALPRKPYKEEGKTYYTYTSVSDLYNHGVVTKANNVTSNGFGFFKYLVQVNKSDYETYTYSKTSIENIRTSLLSTKSSNTQAKYFYYLLNNKPALCFFVVDSTNYTIELHTYDENLNEIEKYKNKIILEQNNYNIVFNISDNVYDEENSKFLTDAITIDFTEKDGTKLDFVNSIDLEKIENIFSILEERFSDEEDYINGETLLNGINLLDDVAYYNDVFYDEYDEANLGKMTSIFKYSVTEGKEQSFSGDDLKIKSTGLLSMLNKVSINGVELSSENYSLEEGSTIITINKDYLNTLDKGEYTLKLDYSDSGYVTAKINIINEKSVDVTDNKEEVTPSEYVDQTTENKQTGYLYGIVTVSVLGLGIYVYLKKYKGKNLFKKI